MTLQVDLMRDQDLRGKRVLIREDLNVPIKKGVVTSDARIRAALPTIEAARAAGARILLMSHLGRPVEGEYDAQYSLVPVAQHLSGLLGQPVRVVAPTLESCAHRGWLGWPSFRRDMRTSKRRVALRSRRCALS